MSNPRFDRFEREITPFQTLFARRDLTTMLLAGTVNPSGPTLEALVASGDPLQWMSVYYLMLNPFSQNLLHVADGYLGEAGYYDEAECLAPHFPLFGHAPTLLLDGPAFIPEEEYRLSFLRRFLLTRAQGKKVLSSLKRFPFDPWNRVSDDMKLTGSLTSAPLSEPEANELLAILLDKRHSDPELEAFFCAWEGAINFQFDSGDKRLASSAVPLKAVVRWYAHLAIAAGHQLP